MIALTIERLGIAILPGSALPPVAPLTRSDSPTRAWNDAWCGLTTTTTTPAARAFLDLVDDRQLTLD